MMFFWEERSIDWYRRAAAYHGFHRHLAGLLAPWIEPGDTVCDLGCGLGQLALALSDGPNAVTAVDVDPAPLAVLREEAGGRPNLEILEADCRALPSGRRWDVAVLCFFGRITQPGNLDDYLSLCGKRLIAVVSASAHSDISPSGRSARQKERVPEVRDYLMARGLSFRLVETALESGQPLESPEEAAAFVGHYAPTASPAEVEAHVRAGLIPLAGGGYYLPSRKPIGIFIVEKPGGAASFPHHAEEETST